MVLGLQVLTAFVLGIASIQDLKTRKISRKVFLIPLVFVLLTGSVLNGAGYGGSMLVQAFIMGFIGFGIRLVSKFGGADILAVALAGSVFPNILAFQVMAFLLVPMLIWLKFWQVLSNSREGPALPGILIGFIILIGASI